MKRSIENKENEEIKSNKKEINIFNDVFNNEENKRIKSNEKEMYISNYGVSDDEENKEIKPKKREMHIFNGVSDDSIIFYKKCIIETKQEMIKINKHRVNKPLTRQEEYDDMCLHLYFKDCYIKFLKRHLKKRYSFLLDFNHHMTELKKYILDLENKIMIMKENNIY